MSHLGRNDHQLPSAHPLDIASAIENFRNAVNTDGATLRGLEISRASHELLEAAKKAAGDPAQTEILIKAMLTGYGSELSKASRQALEGITDPRAVRALRIDEIMSKLDGAQHIGFGMIVEIPENHKELLAELKTFTDDPIFVDRMLESVLQRRVFARSIAFELRTTCLPEKQSEFRSILEQKINSSYESFDRDDLAYLPLALDPESPDNQKLLIRLLNEGRKSFHGEFEPNVIRALSDFKNAGTVDLFLANTLSTAFERVDTEGESAIRLRGQMSPEIRQKLRPLIEGGELKSALALAEIEGEHGLGKLWRAIQIRLQNDGRMIREVRARVAVALADVEPDLSMKVLKGAGSVTSYRLAFARNSILEADA